MRAAVVLPLLALGACWGPRYFAPREHVAATGPEGDLAAIYVVTGDGAQQPRAGEVRVWSHGARALYTDDDREIVELHVGFELENNSDQPLQLDLASVSCEELAIDGVRRGPLAPQRYTGDGLAPPKTTSRVDLVFEPGADAPYEIDGFSVRFVVRAGAGESSREALAQVTPFGPYDPYPYYSDPYWGGWGWGIGFGWSYHHHHCH